MAKIIEHNFNKKAGNGGLDLLTRSFGSYMERLEEKKYLLGEMVMQARLFLTQEGMDPCSFVLSESYLREFLLTDLNGSGEEQGEYAELVYLNCQDGRILAVCQFALPDRGEITISYQIYSLVPDAEGGECWKLYDFQSGSWVDDEEDCFDLNQVRTEYDRFFREIPDHGQTGRDGDGDT